MSFKKGTDYILLCSAIPGGGDGTGLIAEPVPLAKGDETVQMVVAYLNPDGKPVETANNTVIGPVTVTIGE